MPNNYGDCRACPYRRSKRDDLIISGEGAASGLFIVGDAPAVEDERKRKPFSNESGQFLKTMGINQGVDFDAHLIMPFIQCRPPNNDSIDPKAILCCQGNIKMAIAKNKPKKLVTIGRHSSKFLAGVTDILLESGFGRWSSIYQLPVFPLINPSYVYRSTEETVKAKYGRHLGSLHWFITGASENYVKTHFSIITDFDALEKKVDAELKQNSWVTYDIETTGLDFIVEKPLGIGIQIGLNDPFFIPLYTNPRVESAYPNYISRKTASDGFFDFGVSDSFELFWGKDTDRLRQFLWDRIFGQPDIFKVAHNAMFDLLFAARFFGKIPKNASRDTLLAGFCIDSSGRYPLDRFVGNFPELAEYYIDAHRFRQNVDYPDMPSKINGPYCCGDVFACSHSVHSLITAVDKAGVRKLYDLYTDLTEIYAQASFFGVRIDQGWLDGLRKEYQLDSLVLAQAIKTKYNILPDSPKQVSDFLFNELKMPVQKSNKTGPSSDEEALKGLLEMLAGLDSLNENERLADSCAREIMEYRGIAKTLGTYIDGLQNFIVDGRVHPITSLSKARSSRTAMERPNIQNQPTRDKRARRIRGAFIPEPGNCFTGCDLSKAEVVIAAWQSGDQKFIKAVKEGDVYRNVAAELLGVTPDCISKEERNLVWKPTVLANQYLAGAERLQSNINLNMLSDKRITLAQAKNLQYRFAKAYPDFIRWRDNEIAAIELTNCIKNCFGQVRRGDNVGSLFNTLIQGTTSHFMQFGIRDFYRGYLEPLIPLVRFMFNIHDAEYNQHPLSMAKEVTDQFIYYLKSFAASMGCDFLNVDVECFPERWGYKEDI